MAHPNSTLVPHSDLGREIDFLWDRLLLLGTIVFVLVEAALIYIVFKYRHRENQPKPPQTHGNTKLEIIWTLIPAVILVFIAVPTVRTIFNDPGRGGAGIAQDRCDRTPVVVGVQVPRVRHHDGERDLPPRRPHGELHAAIRRRAFTRSGSRSSAASAT